ncbi:G-protein coupled receptor 161-like [Amphiura filiformis]|uniref:G-protein coupled receptor 161-like n=1 Tax=Amphiura filiformis TaxID=82378 RepID=UPI003B21033D
MFINVPNDSSSNLTTLSEDNSSLSLSTLLHVITLSGIILTSLIGNILVLIMFSRQSDLLHGLLSYANRFILQLTVCNLCKTVFLMISTVVATIYEEWVFSVDECVCTGFLMVFFFAASIFTHGMITVDRYVAIITPLSYYQLITGKRNKMMLISVWCIAAVLALPTLIAQDSIDYHKYRYSCTIGSRSNRIFTYIYHTLVILVGFLVPFLGMSFAYYRIYTAARDLVARDRHRWVVAPQEHVQDSVTLDHISSRPRSSTNFGHYLPSWRLLLPELSIGLRKVLRSHVGDELRTATNGLLILFAFLVMWLPFFAVIAIGSAQDGDQHVSPTYLEWVSLWLAYSSCAINPFLYVFRSASMRAHAFAPCCRGAKAGKKRLSMKCGL